MFISFQVHIIDTHKIYDRYDRYDYYNFENLNYKHYKIQIQWYKSSCSDQYQARVTRIIIMFKNMILYYMTVQNRYENIYDRYTSIWSKYDGYDYNILKS